jgi:hypothetical protein
MTAKRMRTRTTTKTRRTTETKSSSSEVVALTRSSHATEAATIAEMKARHPSAADLRQIVANLRHESERPPLEARRALIAGQLDAATSASSHVRR